MGAKEEYERRKAEQARRDQERQAKRGFGKNHFRHPDRMVRFTWWVAAFTFCLAGVGLIQAWAFIQSERAFVAVETIDFLGGNFPVGTPIRIQIVLKNSGKSTGFVDEVVTETRITSRFQPLPKQPVYRKPNASVFGGQSGYPGPILADSRATVTIDSTNEDGIPYTLQEWDAGRVKTGLADLYFFGYISYTDDFSVFGKKTTGFCYFFNYKSNPNVSKYTTCSEKAYTYAE